jgi:hypothetical protein
MSAIADVAKLLEQIPIWKRLKAMPVEIESLQARVVALEALVKARPAPEACPICGVGALKVTAVHAHRQFGDMGLQERAMKCDSEACGHTETRLHDPNGRLGKK